VTTTDDPQASFTVTCDAVGCKAHESITNLVAASAAFDGGPGWTPNTSWFPADWSAVRVRISDEMKRIYGVARLSALVEAGQPVGEQQVVDNFWTFTLCPTHKDADPVIRDSRREPVDDGGDV